MPTGQYKRKKKNPEEHFHLTEDQEKVLTFNRIAGELYLKGILAALPKINWGRVKGAYEKLALKKED
jgi:hypothetical protein